MQECNSTQAPHGGDVDADGNSGPWWELRQQGLVEA